jgi:hypothetical protein
MLFNSGVNNIPMDIGTVAPGLYFIDVLTNGKHITEKLVVN